MLQKLIGFLHIVPFLVIVVLAFGSFLYNAATKNKAKVDFSPMILLLSSIGVASGFGVHSHHASGMLFDACYFCFGYSLVLVAVAYKLIRASRISKEV